MQYIQLQGQIASDLDLPISGSYNLFIDTSDNSIKAKDSDGVVHGGGISLIELTRSEIQTLVDESDLTPGAFYKITGVATKAFYDSMEWSYTGPGNEIQDGGTTIILQATSSKTLSKRGIGLFYVPNYEDPDNPTNAPDYNYLVWDNTHRLDFTNLSGVFDHDEYVQLYSQGESTSTDAYLVANVGNNTLTIVYDSSSDTFLNDSNNFGGLTITGDSSGATADITDSERISSYSANDKVIWGGRVWRNLNGNIGSTTGGWPLAQLTLNSADWEKVAFNETDYTIVADLIEYEFEWDNISYRKSKNNNEVTCIAKVMFDNWGYNTMKYFPWGHYQTQNISISNSYLDAFVNYPHDSWASEIKFDDYGGFNAHYWGRSTEIYNISGDKGAHMVSLNLGYNTEINNIKLGMDAYLSDIYTYDNDNGNTAISNIVLGDNASIDDTIYMYNGSWMENLILENDSHITDINLYSNASIRDSKLGINASISGVGMDPYAAFRQVEMGNSSHISNMNMSVSACFKRVKMGIDSNINAMSIGENGYFKHIEMGDASYMYCNGIGDNSYFQYVNLGIDSGIYTINQSSGNSNFEYVNTGINSEIYSVSLGEYGGFSNIELGINSSINGINATGDYAYISNIKTSNNSYINSIYMGDNSYIAKVDIGSGSGFSDIVLTANSHIENFQIGNDSSFGEFTLTSGADLVDFEIGQSSGFGGSAISSNKNYVTISRGFTNMLNTQVQNAENTNGGSGNPLIDFSNRGIVTIDITGLTTSQGFELPDGEYEGQELIFVVKSDGTHTITADQINIWTNKLVYSGAGYGLGTTTSGYLAFRPFSTWNGTSWDWKNVTKAIWTGGAWVTDAQQFND
jgi:hypothetical protein